MPPPARSQSDRKCAPAWPDGLFLESNLPSQPFVEQSAGLARLLKNLYFLQVFFGLPRSAQGNACTTLSAQRLLLRLGAVK